MEAVDIQPTILSQDSGSINDDFRPRIVEELAQDAQEFSQVVEQCRQNATVHSDVANACVTLHDTQSAQPTELELALIHQLLSQCGSKKQVVIHAIIIASVKWNVVDLWAKTVQFCCEQGTVPLVRAQWVVLAIQKFGLGQVQPTLQYMLALETITRPLIGLFNEILMLKDSQGAGYLPRDAIEWISERRRKLCVKIEQSMEDSYDRLIHKCLVKGGIEYMHEHVLPVCIDASTEMFLRTLALRVHQDEAFIESSTKRKVITELLKAVITKTDILSEEKIQELMSSAQILLRLSVDTNCDEAGALVVEQLCDTSNPASSAQRLDRTRLLISLLIWSADNLKAIAGTPSFLRLLQRGANDYYMAYLLFQIHAGDRVSTHTLTALTTLIQASGGAGDLLSSLSSKLDEIAYDILHDILRFIKPWFPQILENYLLTEQLKAILQHFAEEYKIRSTCSVEDTMAYVEPCIDARLPESTSLIIDKIIKHFYPSVPSPIYWGFNAQTGRRFTRYSKDGLERLLMQLIKRAQEPDGMDVILGPGVCAVIKSWIQADREDPNVVPTARFISDQERMRAKWSTEEGCGCVICNEIFDFLAKHDHHAIMRVTRLAKGQEDTQHSVQHVKRILGSLVTSEIATWTFETRPEPLGHFQDLWIFKSHQLYRPSYSPEFKQRVEEFITMAAGKDEADRARILGPGYEEVKHWMDGPHLLPQQELEPVLGEKRAGGEDETKEPEQPPKRRRTRNRAA